MRGAPLRRPRAATAAVLTAAVVLTACTGGSAPAPTASPRPATPVATPTASPPSAAPATTSPGVATPAPLPSAPPSAAPVATAGVADLGLAIDADTRWGDLFETLTAAEQACFRDEFGAALEETLAQPIGETYTEAWEVTAFACLAPATARAVLLEALLAGMAEDGLEPGAEERACLRTTLGGADVAAAIAAGREGDPAFAELAGALLGCLPDVFLDLILLNTGLEAAGLDADERACLLDAFDAGDWVAVSAGDAGAGVTFAVDLWGCVPALFLSDLVGEQVTLREAEAVCLRAAFAGLAADELLAVLEGRGDGWAAFGEILACVPGLLLVGAFGPELALELSDAEAACLRESFAGLDWYGRRVVPPEAEIAVELVRCVPDLLVGAMLAQVGGDLTAVSEDELTCMREWAAGLDIGQRLAAVSGGDDLAAMELGVAFFACAPRLLVSGEEEAAAAPRPRGDGAPTPTGTPTPAALTAPEPGLLDGRAARPGAPEGGRGRRHARR